MSLNYSKSWLQFLSEVERVKESLDFEENEECFFRGHTQTSYSLIPGLYRGLKKHYKKIPDYLWQTESDLFYEFRSKARDLHSLNLIDWDILFYMQHHGVKTRLLDWSESLGVAMYFALLDYKKDLSNPCIWIMNPFKLNEEYHESRDLWDPILLNYYENYYKKGESYDDLILYENTGDIIPWNEPIALYPVRRASRLATQSGYFTVHGNDSRPIEKIIPEGKKIYKKIVLPHQAVDSAKAFLEHAGINQFSLFPDMDGLAEYLNKKYLSK